MMSPERITLDFSDGNIVIDLYLTEGDHGWGVDRIEIKTETPVNVAAVANFIEACGTVVATSPSIAEVVRWHNHNTSSRHPPQQGER